MHDESGIQGIIWRGLQLVLDDRGVALAWVGLTLTRGDAAGLCLHGLDQHKEVREGEA